ncbi:MAG: dihydroneopterin aldolase, partial [Candidatus Sericytochromatia bacterium]|nr:dihydroneopterin aldolase [Candidatus Sericytochromatia bacterium]
RCTYCIVPYVRGNEISRRPEAIVTEVARLGMEGFKEITLLGQNVDSYGDDLSPESSLAELMHLLDPVPGIERIRFMTSHPADMTDALVDAVATLPKVCEYIHLPLQAGNDRVLRFMARGYTMERYAALADQIRRKVPGVALTSDLIVGFPGETEEEFLDSVAAVKRFNFDMVNTAAYSPRKGTPAARMKGQLPEAEKMARLSYLNQVVQETARAINGALIGQVQEVLVERPNPKQPEQMTGRTRTNKIVHLIGDCQVGDIVQVTISGASPWSLRGEIVAVPQLILAYTVVAGPSDTLSIHGIEAYGLHGVAPEERVLGQRFVVDLDLEMDLSLAGKSDDLADTLSYVDVVQSVQSVVGGQSCQLIEALAERVAAEILQFAIVGSVVVRLHKPHIPVAGFSGAVSVSICRRR